MARVKTFTNGGGLLPSDLNSIQDDYETRAEALAIAGGVNSLGVVRRGKSIVATEESITGTTYLAMPTPNRVSNIVLPADGVLFVLFDALVKTTHTDLVSSIGEVALFLNGTQLQMADGRNAATAQKAVLSNTVNVGGTSTAFTGHVYSSAFGLSRALDGTASYPDTDVTTGMAWPSGAATWAPGSGAILPIRAAAGTYTVEVRAKHYYAGGPVYMKDRKLWVWTAGF